MPTRKLTPEQIEEIQVLFDNGIHPADIAKCYDVSMQTVRNYGIYGSPKEAFKARMQNLGFERPKDMLDNWARRNGHKSYADYQRSLLPKRDASNWREYRVILAKRLGFDSPTRYREFLLYQQGFDSFTDYYRHLARINKGIQGAFDKGEQ